MKPLMRWMHKYVVNRNIFRDCPKLFLSITRSRKLSGREFQTNGPATQKNPSTIATEPVVWYDQELSGGRPDIMLPRCDACNWLAQFHEAQRCLTVQAVEHHDAKLVHHNFFERPCCSFNDSRSCI